MFSVTPIPAFSDNYIWLLKLPDSQKVAVVDPGDAAPVIAYLNDNSLELDSILITHHHYDHTDGVKELTDRYQVPVYGPHNSPFSGITNPLKENDTLDLWGQKLVIKEIPGHTLDHISYFSSTEQPQLFCGDTLFLAGCGRLFEGTPQQMLAAMNHFHSLPDNTEVYCTHEYSLANLAFAEAVEPDNADVKDAINQCTSLRNSDRPTLPSSIAQEKRINPFMRSDQTSVISAAKQFTHQTELDQEAVFAAIREWKNQF
ncbi:hydroxyacylglutathione hydrolase [Neptuniibacter sp. PT8_73]|uniref:hydroxyacylglutathione hydrolase n=1 Tax=unclassified Neptuniibacter TaxID=2630693 RepID=UPI0039F50026